jgi:hypothetical protein
MRGGRGSFPIDPLRCRGVLVVGLIAMVAKVGVVMLVNLGCNIFPMVVRDRLIAASGCRASGAGRHQGRAQNNRPHSELYCAWAGDFANGQWI